MIKIKPFALERYFDRHEFSAKYLLSCSDCEPLTLSDLLALADEESLGLWDNLTLAYTHTSGHPVLREAVAGSYAGIEPEDIQIAVPEEGIYLSMQAILEPGDHVVCTCPGYQSLYELARAMGCDVSMWTIREEPDWHFDLSDLEALLRPDTKLVVVNFPHNPTGFLPEKAFFADLVKRVRESGAFLFSDEMYRLLEFDDAETLPSACELYDKAVSLSGLSKAYGLPGLRLGWLACRDKDFLRHVAHLKDYTTICNSAPSEIMGLMAVRARARIVAGQRSRISRNMKVLGDFMQVNQRWFSWSRPSAGSLCFLRMRNQENAQLFCEKAVRDAGIMLVPSTMFDYGDRHIRIGYGREDFPDALDRLGRYLEKLGDAPPV